MAPTQETRYGNAMNRPRDKTPGAGILSAQAICLRDWALHLLGTVDGPPDWLWEAAQLCHARSWELFLRLERCALALQTRLDSGGGWTRLPEAAAAVIRSRATDELQRVLSARAQIRTVARLAAKHGWKVLVLKGGVAAAAGELIDLGDVDILVEPERIAEVAAALDQLGFERHGLDHASPHHLAARAQPNGLHIEVHHSLKGGPGLDAFLSAAVPLSGEPALSRQGTVDHLRYLLHHATYQHPERTGRIRDLLLVGHALRSASPTEVALVEAEFLESEQVGRDIDSVRAMLRLARALEERAFQGSDPHRGVALRSYILFGRRWWFTSSRGGMQILVYAARIAVRGRRHWLDEYHHLRAHRMNTISANRFFVRLERRAPLLAGAARQLLRLLTFTAAMTYALITEIEARAVERTT